MGYMKSGSQKSLLAGGISASVLYYVFTQLPANPVYASSIGLGERLWLLFLFCCHKHGLSLCYDFSYTCAFEDIIWPVPGVCIYFSQKNLFIVVNGISMILSSVVL